MWHSMQTAAFRRCHRRGGLVTFWSTGVTTWSAEQADACGIGRTAGGGQGLVRVTAGATRVDEDPQRRLDLVPRLPLGQSPLTLRR